MTRQEIIDELSKRSFWETADKQPLITVSDAIEILDKYLSEEERRTSEENRNRPC